MVYEARGHSFTSKWLILHDPADLNLGSTGFIKIDVSLKGGGLVTDAVTTTPDDAEEQEVANADAAIEKNLLMPPMYGGAIEQVRSRRRHGKSRLACIRIGRFHLFYSF